MLGRVGISGITTTPHLHIQLDTEDAPFHPYWPFTSADSRSAGLGFFDSVNAGLGKESALRYSIHPMNFIKMFAEGIYPAPNSMNPVNSIEDLESAPQIPREQELIGVNAPVESMIASTSSKSSVTTGVVGGIKSNSATTTQSCSKKRFSDVSTSTKV